YHLRCHLGGLCPKDRLAEARCGHLLMAESAWQRGRARNAYSLAACGGKTRNLQTGLAAAEDLPSDERRKAQRGNLRRGDHQYAVDAVRGRLSLRLAVV